MIRLALHHGDQAMKGIITLTDAERKTLLDWYRQHCDPAVRVHAQIILLLADGFTWAMIAAVLDCSSRTIARWQQRFRQGRVPALLGRKRGPPRRGDGWIETVVAWVLHQTPRAFGLLRSRWCCAVLVLVL